ncbi:MAG: hypothetical protein JWM71_2448 [Solirubrobacteraceae bacterium]|nr:hypothetical protein [Solirubrobacteraceae bacterium]
MLSMFESAWMRRPLSAKVPAVTAAFWVLKLLTTGIGESSSDYLGARSIPLAVLIGGGGIALTLWRQLTATRYSTWTYWLTVLMVAVFGTMVADAVHRGAGVPYIVSTPLFAAAVAVIFVVWRRCEGTLSIHSITTRRRELFYWSAVLATFALGTAAGDLTALTLHLGFLGSVGLFAAGIAMPAIGWSRLGLNSVLAFWAAYVVTRPLGASIADWLAKRHSLTGLGVGDGPVSAVGLVLFATLVAYIALRGRDAQVSHAEASQLLPDPSG